MIIIIIRFWEFGLMMIIIINNMDFGNWVNNNNNNEIFGSLD